MWVSGIPLALAQPHDAPLPLSQALLLPDFQEQRGESLQRDDGTITSFAGQRVVVLLAERFGPVERAQVRIKTANHASSAGDQRRRDHRSWALVTFVDEDHAIACVHQDGMLVPEALPWKPGFARVPLKIRPADVSAELAKGHRGALAQVAARDAQQAALDRSKKLNVMKRPTLKDAVRSVIQMQQVAKQFHEGLAAPKPAASVAPVDRGRAADVRWIAEDPCGLAIGPQPWTERNTSYHRSVRSRPSIKHVRRTVVRLHLRRAASSHVLFALHRTLVERAHSAALCCLSLELIACT